MNVAAHSIRDTRTSRVGMVMMLLGALLAIGGLVQTTTSHFTDQSCPSGTTLIAKFTYDHGYSFDSPSGNSHVVTLTHTSASGADWSSTQAISNVIVKGGPSAVMTSLTPPQTSGHFSNAGLPTVGHDNLPDISNVQFCGSTVQQQGTSTTANCQCTTTTTSPTTSTTSNCGCTTTTTVATTSTTTHCTCSTTTTSTTTTPTTQPQETTTSKATTTTSSSTTTTSTTTPVTEPHETTTTSSTSTTVPESTTSSTRVAGSTVVGATTSTTEHVQGSTTTSGPVVTSTTVLTPTGTKLPFTGGQSGPLLVLGILFLASGAALTLSATRGRRGSRA